MSGQISGRFGEARRNPDKLAQPLFGRKVPFQDHASPTIPCPRFLLLQVKKKKKIGLRQTSKYGTYHIETLTRAEFSPYQRRRISENTVKMRLYLL
jgi:hypothetical protein